MESTVIAAGVGEVADGSQYTTTTRTSGCDRDSSLRSSSESRDGAALAAA